ncbi:uncharacterized protein GGS22DRAFT_97376 [Annulohypoxylon maeteangense]|uniref:uncharacterized protein n=1 Tax=Annulohypoxylon maeteangense TaxID=1927788 RepID=UPI0020076478|nr:uncharacterized protein GGS22DRAFT_97376 [Annulohypoxylon maeteangense]KAI0888449.1 hypothetical protein GGS22DRAFT_97376 [Annulohypoxylon maeteangense]
MHMLAQERALARHGARIRPVRRRLRRTATRHLREAETRPPPTAHQHRALRTHPLLRRERPPPPGPAPRQGFSEERPLRRPRPRHLHAPHRQRQQPRRKVPHNRLLLPRTHRQIRPRLPLHRQQQHHQLLLRTPQRTTPTPGSQRDPVPGVLDLDVVLHNDLRPLQRRQRRLRTPHVQRGPQRRLRRLGAVRRSRAKRRLERHALELRPDTILPRGSGLRGLHRAHPDLELRRRKRDRGLRVRVQRAAIRRLPRELPGQHVAVEHADGRVRERRPGEPRLRPVQSEQAAVDAVVVR